MQPGARVVSETPVMEDLIMENYTEHELEGEARLISLEKLNNLHQRDIELEAYVNHNNDVKEARRAFFISCYHLAFRLKY